MRVADEHLSEIRTRGYTLGPGFLADDDLGAAQACLWDEFPRPADYFADPSAHHRDFGNHSLVVPRTDGIGAQLTSFILLSDLTPLDGPTAVIPITHSEHIPMVPDDTEPGWPLSVQRGNFADVEILATAPAGRSSVSPVPATRTGTTRPPALCSSDIRTST